MSDETVKASVPDIQALLRENRVLRLKNAGTLANNLCPDHRDKQHGQPCLACTIERLQAKLEEARELLADARRDWGYVTSTNVLGRIDAFLAAQERGT